MAECLLPKQDVVGSNPITRSIENAETGPIGPVSAFSIFDYCRVVFRLPARPSVPLPFRCHLLHARCRTPTCRLLSLSGIRSSRQVCSCRSGQATRRARFGLHRGRLDHECTRHPWIIARRWRHHTSTVHFYMSTLRRWSESLVVCCAMD